MIEIFLHPGEYCVVDARYRIRTLLGSCVSITLWHPARRIGAMSHCLLSSRGAAATDELDGRYADEALSLMLRDLALQHVMPSDCQAKLFGGGNMFPHYTNGAAHNIGQLNGDGARLLLRSHGIPVVSESLFGIGHRRIIFDVATGDVWAAQTDPQQAALPDDEVP
jgi:chemotaxis protein CheD